MQEKNQDKRMAAEIYSMQDIPELFRFNRDGIWDKLEENLLKESAIRKKYNRVWFVAAIILCVIISNVIITVSPQKNQRQTAMIGKQNPGKPEVAKQIRVEMIQPKHKKPARLPHLFPNSIYTNKPDTIREEPVKSLTFQPTETEEIPAIETSSAIQNTGQSLQRFIPVKKKLKVVHLNELMESIRIQNSTAEKSDTRRVPLSLPDEKELLPLPENTRQFLYFKVKTAPHPATTINDNH